MLSLLEERKELLRCKHEIEYLKVTLKYVKFLRAAIKAGFNPDQPRDDIGRWTNEGATQAVGPEGNTDFSASRRIAAVDYSDAMTGISTIDETTIALSATLGRTMETMDFIPEWTPQVYGTAVHVAFGTAVRFEGLRGIGFGDVEHSFVDGRDADYGESGSIRTDVVLRNEVGDIIAIYDVKTGRGGLSPARVNQIREQTRVQPSVPIVELHILRGARLKSRALLRDILGAVIARLYDPLHHRDNRGLRQARFVSAGAG
ncbi:MAG: hypothetical protein HXX15_15730 [Rhodopseudomonas sp.]|uniref:hypothetical protein n=1 Tax=Rhodopseudomonas sp. TaxID=1078 RepID=UPI00182FE88A|nr:hypothetical protein [Rhodopseudomonas sp.]NVN87527.1 hypothetical protein [Rhodopseudomonas sp.]